MNKKDEKNKKCSEKKMFTDSFGIVDLTNKEAKEEHFGEIAQYEEARVKEAQRKFHARMTQHEKEEAAKWIGYYRYMVVDADEK